MKRICLILILLCLYTVQYSQNYHVNFESSNENIFVEEVYIRNITKNISISISGNETLHLIPGEYNKYQFLSEEPVLYIYPNPSNINCYIVFESNKESSVNISINDISGKIILSDDFRIEKGVYTFEIEGLIFGVYNISVLSNDFLISEKLISTNRANNNLSIKYLNHYIAENKTDNNKISKSNLEFVYDYGDILLIMGISDQGQKHIVPFVLSENEDNPENIIISFDFIDCPDDENNHYPILKIQNNYWMAENLNNIKYSDGSEIPNVKTSNEWRSLVTGAYSDYNNLEENAEQFGRLYNWYAVSDSRNICPESWLVPEDSHWRELEFYLGMQSQDLLYLTGWRGNDIGCHIKESEQGIWHENVGENLNLSGFSAMPGGIRSFTGDFYYKDRYAAWWTSTESLSISAWLRAISYNSCGIFREDGRKTMGFSVRCVKNIEQVSNELPNVQTLSISEITESSAVYEGEIFNNEQSPIISKGFVWSTSSQFDINNNEGIIVSGMGAGVFSEEITNLIPNNTYYIKAFGENDAGIAYGDQLVFTSPHAYNTGPFCEGEPILLFANNGTSYEWTGPEDFYSEEQNPEMYEATIEMGGVFNLTIVDNYGNVATTSTEIVVLPAPDIQISYSGPVCETESVELFSEGGEDYFWSGPLGFNSVEQNPILVDVEIANAGYYFLTVTGANNCQSNDSVEVAIYQKPEIAILNAGNYCLGDTPELSANVTGNSPFIYNWTGPDDFSENTEIINLNGGFELNGFYYLEITDDNNCITIDSAHLIINPVPTESPDNTGPYCDGQDILLFASGGTSYEWSGPQDFSYSGQNPVIENSSAAMSGSYFVVITNDFNCQSEFSTEVIITELYCPASMTDLDGNMYGVVKIGCQCWMSDNLRTTTYSDLAQMFNLEVDEEWMDTELDDISAFCWYENQSLIYGGTYGALYNFYAVLTEKICPEGWKVPTHEDWTILEREVCSGTNCEEEFPVDFITQGWLGTVEGSKLAGKVALWNSGQLSLSESFNESEFDAVPAGLRTHDGGNYTGLGNSTSFWTATEADPNNAWVRKISYDSEMIGRFPENKMIGYSVRCIRDFDFIANIPTITTNPVINITASSASSGGDIIDNGGAEISSFGIVWGTEVNPSLENNEGYTYDGFGIGVFESHMYDLTASTQYYVRAYATNIEGIAYGENITFNTLVEFTCGDPVMFIYKGENVIYGTVDFAERCWLDRNLGAMNVSVASDDFMSYGDLFQWGREADLHQDRNSGTILSQAPVNLQPGHDLFIITNGLFDDWNENEDWIYRWANNMGEKNDADPCPVGWRVPRLVEWIDAYNSETWINGEEAFNSSLKLSYTGFRDQFNNFSDLNDAGLYWSSDHVGFGFASAFAIVTDYVEDVHYGAVNGLAVRCIQDNLPLSELPVVETVSVTDITSNSASAEGKILSSGGSAILNKGFVWSTTQEPTVEVNEGLSDEGAGPGIFTGNIQSLSSAQTYYLRAYATNSAGTVYGSELVFNTINAFTCGDPVMFNYNGTPVVYLSVITAGKCWLDRNLGALQVALAPGDIPAYGDLFQWGREDDGHQLRSSNLISVLAPPMMQPGHPDFIFDSKLAFEDWNEDGLWIHRWDDELGEPKPENPCPQGWRVPSVVEWEAFQTIESINNGIDAFNSALKLPLAGYRDGWSGVTSEGTVGRYWTSDNLSTSIGNYFMIDNFSTNITNEYNSFGFSIRCIHTTWTP